MLVEHDTLMRAAARSLHAEPMQRDDPSRSLAWNAINAPARNAHRLERMREVEVHTSRGAPSARFGRGSAPGRVSGPTSTP